MEVLAVCFLQQQPVGPFPSLIGLVISMGYGTILAPWPYPMSCSYGPDHRQVGLSLYCTVLSATVHYHQVPCHHTSSQQCLPWLGRAVSDPLFSEL